MLNVSDESHFLGIKSLGVGKQQGDNLPAGCASCSSMCRVCRSRWCGWPA